MSPIEIFNGQRWAAVPSPTPAGYANLNGVSCTSPTFCVAVGSYGLGGIGSLIESYNGSHWTVVGHPQSLSYLRAVACTAPNFCVAVGNFGSSADDSARSIVLTFNGHVWTVTSNPNLAGGSTLGAVSCSGARMCVAVGDGAVSVASAGESRTLIERYNGSTWVLSQG